MYQGARQDSCVTGGGAYHTHYKNGTGRFNTRQAPAAEGDLLELLCTVFFVLKHMCNMESRITLIFITLCTTLHEGKTFLSLYYIFLGIYMYIYLFNDKENRYGIYKLVIFKHTFK